MSIIERYIWQSVLFSILVTWLSLTMLDGFFAFLSELGDVSQTTHYGNLQAFYYILLGTPKRLYDYFPTATLIGSLLGLGNLAANSELTAMRAAGVAIRQIVSMTLKLGLMLALVVFVLGEWVAPHAEQAANSFKVQMQQKQLAVSEQGVWIKDGNRILNVAKLWSEKKLEGLSIYQINPQEGRIESITRAANAERDAQGWVMHDIKRQIIRSDGITHESFAEIRDDKLIPEHVLTIAAVKPNQLAARELAEFIQHQRSNDLSSDRFEQAFWQHFTTPLSTLVMLIIAAPFVFSFQRNAGAGQRIFIGIIIGIVFFLFNRILGNMGIVYGIPPLLAATLPLLVFLSGGLWMLRRVR
ncbi:MAG: LPS export ABC transporter permease LptG [Thiothrix sp.]|uniref:LPS export ABC transporter permease LptG n=1 Tax=Thiothrix sp. TaxID=1032 RepID=UPI00261437A7|nr:LPS export ABC transporter permease LptG [Thiothrix sp.]MDD5393242.1 LPS export ABC transporter permease LptG [Thiothrix sp.]